MTRFCECGCNQPVSGRARFVDAKHRARHWRASHVVAAPVEHPRAGAKARSGKQISYAKAVARVARYIESTRMGVPGTVYMAPPEVLADAILREALPERQRDRT